MISDLVQHLDVAVLSAHFTAFLPRLAGAVSVALVFWLAIAIIKRVLANGLRRGGVPPTAGRMLVRFVRYGLISVALLTIAAQLGVNVTSLVAGLGIVALAVSFAAQDTVTNLISGITLAVDRPFAEGDWVQWSDTHAMVTEMRLRTTVLTTFDNETIVVPNRLLAQERVITYTLTPRIRVRVSVGIAYKESVDQAREILLGLVTGDERILPEPEPMVIVTQLGNSSVDLELRFWTEDSLLKYPLEWAYTEAAKKALDSAGVQIPFPHLQLFIEDSDGVKRLAAPHSSANA